VRGVAWYDSGVDGATRQAIFEYVKPLAVGPDGVTNSGDIERILAVSEKIAAKDPRLDRDLLFLLTVFSGQEKWVSRMGHRSRTEILLASLGVPAKRIQALFRGLARLERGPATPEEEVVHDALRLDAIGAYGIARHVVEGYREGMDFPEMADAVESAAREPLLTEAGRALSEGRRKAMLEFARQLRSEYEEFKR
jgi:hypothetical protein